MMTMMTTMTSMSPTMTDHSPKPESSLTTFNDLLVPHPRMEEVLKTLAHFTAEDTASNIVLLTGPTGAGKSATVEKCVSSHIKSRWDQITADPGIIPAFAMPAPAVGQKAFSWRLFYRTGMSELCEPLIDKKRQNARPNGAPLRLSKPSMRTTLSDLHISFGNALIERETRFFVIDEAAHMLSRVTKGDNMDALKSLSDRSNTTIVLAGSYDLLDVLDLNSQLARRCSVVHFSRYRQDNQDDVRVFRKVVRSLLRQMALEPTPQLTDKQIKTLMESSVGCVGILKTILRHTYARCLREYAGEWNIEALRCSLPARSTVNSILRDIQNGEARLSRGKKWDLD